jgi:hypothetical protein
MEKTTNETYRCPKYETCSIPLCPLDNWTNERIKYADEPKCPFASRRKGKIKDIETRSLSVSTKPSVSLYRLVKN